MKITQYMTPDPITVSVDTLLPEARKILNTYRIRHLPVTGADGKLVGIVTDRDLRSAYPSSVTTKKNAVLSFEQVEKTVVADIMTPDCSTLPPNANLDDALEIFDRDKVGGIPIVDEEEKIVGFFSMLDLIAAYRRLFGMLEQGSVLVGIVDDGEPHGLCEIAKVFAENDITMTRLMRLEEKGENARLFMRVNGQKQEEIEMLLQEKGFVVIES